MSSNDDITLPPPSPNPAQTLPSDSGGAAVPSQSPAKQFGDYELINEIARGGMGVVYKARQVSLNRTVALKMILTGKLASESDVRRFYQEAESAANLDHSGIVPIYDIGEHDGNHFFSMKFIDGGSLAEALPELRKEPRKLVSLIADVARAVHHAHQRGILHRDLKPANILLDEKGQPLVSDLGLAKQIQSDSNITHTGAVVGTPAYMPPEQASATKEITTAADIYSIGAMLYEALTGRPPHKADSPMQTLLLVMEGKVTPPREIDRSVDRSLDLICMKCLEKQPEERYSSAAALADDLENWLEGKSVSVRPPSVAANVATALAANIRSALGAGMLGIAAGLLLAVCMGEAFTSNAFVENSSARIYAEMQSEVPFGRNLVYIRESEVNELTAIAAAFGLLFCMGGLGICVTTLTRPKPGAAPLAMGLVAALMMAVTCFVAQIGPLGYGLHLQSTLLPRLETLNQIAVGTPEQVSAARSELADEFPALKEVTPDDKANVLAYRMFYDSFLQAPVRIYWGFGLAAFFALPSIFTTMFSARVRAQRGKMRFVILPYIEFIWFVYAFLMSLFTFFLLNNGQSVWGNSNPPPIPGQVFTLLILGGMVVLLYKRMLPWKWRLGFYASSVVLGVLVAIAN